MGSQEENLLYRLVDRQKRSMDTLEQANTQLRGRLNWFECEARRKQEIDDAILAAASTNDASA